jgi:hypothetical protein
MQPPSSLTIPPAVGSVIGRYRLRKTMLRATVWLGAALSAGLFLFLSAICADRFFDMRVSLRVLMSAVALTVPALIFLIGLFRVFQGASTEAIAGEIDSVLPGSRDLLRTSVHFTAPGRDPPSDDRFLLDRTLEQANGVALTVKPAGLLGWGKAPRAFLALIILVPALYAVFHTPMMDADWLLQRFLHPTSNLRRPSLVRITAEYPKTILQRDDVMIVASVTGDGSENLPITIDMLSSGATNSRAKDAVSSVVMTPRPGGRFGAMLKDVVEPVTFTLWAGDGRSERHVIAVTPRPALTKTMAHYISPSYAQLPPRQGPIQLHEVKGLEGTRIRVEFESSIPVMESKVVFPNRQLAINWDKSRTQGVFQFTLEKETFFKIQLSSDNRSDNHNEPPFRVRILPDSPPTVTLLGVPENLTFYRDDVINLSYKGSDDYGISDVFLRYRESGGTSSKDFTLRSYVGAGTKDVAADFSLAIRDIVKPDADWVELELVMVDSKGQESTAQAIRLALISNTPDRQLIELIGYQDHYHSSISRSARVLKDAAFRLAILVKGMADGDKLADSRAATFDEVRRQLAEVSFPRTTDDPIYRLLPISEYPYLAQRRTHDLLTRAAALPDYTSLAPALESAAKSASPRQELAQLKERIDRFATLTQRADSTFKSLRIETRLALLCFIASDYIGEAHGESPTTRAAEPASESAAIRLEKQEERIRTLVTHMDVIAAMKIDDAELAGLFANVKAAAALPGEARAKPLLRAVTALRARLDLGGEFESKLSTDMESYVRENPWPVVFREAVEMGSVPRADLAVALWVRLIRNNVIFNTPDYFMASAVQQAAQTGDAERLNRAIAAADALRDWSRRGDLYERVQWLRRTLTNTDIEVRLKRISMHGPEFDETWRRVREVYLSIVSDAAGGRFTDLGVDEELTALTAARGGFASWQARDTIGSTEWPRTRATAMRTLDSLAQSLLPKTRDGRIQALAMIVPMLNDLSKNMTDEHTRLLPELELIKADVAAAALVPPSENNKVLPGGKTWGRKAEPGRIAFTKAISERFTAYAAVIGAINDLRQSAWSDHPTADAVPELLVGCVLFEYLSNLDEEVYDRTYAMHLKQILGAASYPQFVDETGRYMNDLALPASIVDAAVRRITAGDWAGLAGDAKFMSLPRTINKHTRFDAQVKSIDRQLQFIKAFVADGSEQARGAMLRAMYAEQNTSTAYWDRLYLSCALLYRESGAGEKAGDTAKWTGLDAATLKACAATVLRVRLMMPDDTSGVELKTVKQAVDDFREVEAIAPADKIAGMSASAQRDAYDAYDEWRGKILAAMEVMTPRVTIASIKHRPRARLMQSRADFENIIGRLTRSESDWTLRLADAGRVTASTRAQLLATDADPPVTPDDLAFDFAREGAVRRRSAAAMVQASRNIDFDSGVDAQFLKMPKYLYEQLIKTGKKPFPAQFEDSGKNYTQNLLKDAR